MDSFRLGYSSNFNFSFYENINAKIQSLTHDSLNYDMIFNKDITLDEVKKVMHDLKRGKAVGIDGIMNEVLKYVGEKLIIESLETLQFLNLNIFL